MKFTEEQQKVIDTRNRNLLVSASAGSGKTAVLVERIIQMISDDQQPIDINRLLVVTFTNAAAAEMKHRISVALEKKIAEDSDDHTLKRQYVLLNHSNIMTIHAFCLSVIKTYYNQIDLDPGFRIGDTIEIELIKKQVLGELLEEEYGKGNKDFERFVESYSSGKTDEEIEELVLMMYRFSMSNLWPEKWLDENLEKLNINDNQYFESAYFIELIKQVNSIVDNVRSQLDKAREMCLMNEGPEMLIENIKEYLALAEAINDNVGHDFNHVKKVFDCFEASSVSRKRKGFDQGLLTGVKGILKEVKEIFKDLQENYFYAEADTVIFDIVNTYKDLSQLVRLTQLFLSKFNQTKRDKDIIDFTDIEHLALKILIDENGQVTEVAKVYRESFDEILIDEYQDSNIIQETILKSVSKVDIDQPNTFMVGDVKQSIYKFRLAKPELFMDKFNRYSEEESLYQLINLSKNFRSRKEVIDSINYTFKQLMSYRLGDVQYNEKAFLYQGADYEEKASNYKSEILLIDTSSDDGKNEGEGSEEFSKTEKEAIVITNRIKELIESKMIVYDKGDDCYREIMYKDIVILLRSAANTVDTFIEILGQGNIPAYADNSTGYFETVEIKVLTNILKVIDNPRQDIPLVSVLRSPVVGLNEDDLARIRICFKNAEYYMALMAYIEGSIDYEETIYKKVSKFIGYLKEWRRLAKIVSVDELIYKIFEDTHYDQYVTLMPNGLKRKANINMFVEKAIAFEKTSFRGVFDFIKYIEKMKKYEMDIGEAVSAIEDENLVRIMTIHKSKGLEFPVVILGRMDKRFNYMDLNKKVVFHQNLGFASDFIDSDNRFMQKTIPKTIIIKKNKEELLSEEMRVFYVALTRAREKLILCGNLKDAIEKVENLEVCNIEKLTASNSYMDWMINGVIPRWDINEFYDIKVIDEINSALLTEQIVTEPLDLQKLMVEDCNHEEINHLLEYQYPYDVVNRYTVTQSVSDIKRMMEEETALEKEIIKPIPSFIAQSKPLTSAEKGTLYHKVMYHLDMKLSPDKRAVDGYLMNLVNKNIITEVQKKVIYGNNIVKFLNSSLCQRISASQERVRRETPFVVGILLKDMYPDINIDIDESVMLQGVIDLYFEEDGELVLVDYKTDYIEEGNEEILVSRYTNQMTYYKKALEDITGMTVKEVILYSIGRGIEVVVDL